MGGAHTENQRHALKTPTAVMFASGPHQSLAISRDTWQVVCRSLEIALTLCGQSNFSSLLRMLCRASGALSEAGAL